MCLFLTSCLVLFRSLNEGNGRSLRSACVFAVNGDIEQPESDSVPLVCALSACHAGAELVPSAVSLC